MYRLPDKWKRSEFFSLVISRKQIHAPDRFPVLQFIQAVKIRLIFLRGIIKIQPDLPLIFIPGFHYSCHCLFKDFQTERIKEKASVHLCRNLINCRILLYKRYLPGRNCFFLIPKSRLVKPLIVFNPNRPASCLIG